MTPIESTAIAPGALERAAFGVELAIPERRPILSPTPGAHGRHIVERRGAIRWRATGLVVRPGVVMPDGGGGWEVYEPTAFIAQEGPRYAVPVLADHDYERILGTGYLEWVNGAWHARASVHTPPMPAGWSPRFGHIRSTEDGNGVRHHHLCRLLELTLSTPTFTAWGHRSVATLALETSSLFDR